MKKLLKNKIILYIISLCVGAYAGYKIDLKDLLNNDNKNEIIIETSSDVIISDNESKEIKESSTEAQEESSIEVIESEEPVEVIEDTTELIEKDVYFTKAADLYDEINGNIINNVEIYNKAYEISRNNNWSLIRYNDENFYTLSANLEELPETYVEIDISDQIVNLIVNNELTLQTPTVTGKNSTPTRIGYFAIFDKNQNRYLNGPGYSSHVNYFMPFDKGIGLHDALWRDEFGGEIYKKGGSHGCVNLPLDAAETIYDNVEIGTKVLVHN